MRHSLAIAVLCSVGVMAQLADIDFNRLAPAPQHIDSVGKMDGFLPVGVNQDFATWSPGICETSTELDTLGDHFLRFTIRKGGAQFNIPLPGLQARTPYKVTITARNLLPERVAAYMRQMGPPYKQMEGRFPLPASETFGKYAFHFQTAAVPKGGAGLFIRFSQTGQFDVKRVTIEEISADEFAQMEADEMVRIIRPPADATNFLTYSSLPWGLQAGWSRRSTNNGDHAQIAPAPAVIGPSGQPALLLDAPGDDSVALVSEPFAAAAPSGEVTVSFAYRGTGTATAEIHAGYTKLAKPLTLTPQADAWQRATLTGRIPLKRLAAVLDITCKGGRLYVDAFRVAPKGADAFAAAFPHEIHFRLPLSDAAVSRIQFTDEPAKLELLMTGTPEPDTVIRLAVTDLYKATVPLAAVPCTTTNQTFAVTYTADADRVGQFHVEAQAFRGSTAVSAVHEFVVTRLARPVYWGKDAPSSPFGIHTNQLESSLRALKAGGFNWARCHDGARHLTCWHFLEPQPGQWAFRDEALQAYRRNHLMLYGQLGGAPIWATDLKNLPERYHHQYASVYYTPEDAFLPAYANYCETMARRYRGIIDDWFIWNEPWGALFFHKSYDPATNTYTTWGGKQQNAAYYTKISKITFDAAKKGNPQCRVTGFNAYADNGEWVRDIYDNGGYDACDEVDFHHYANTSQLAFPDDGCRDRIQKTFATLIDKEGGLRKPCLMSEGQAGSAAVLEAEPHIGMLKHTLTWASQEHARNTATAQVRYIVGYLAAGCKRVFLYTAHAYSDLSRGSDLQLMLGADGYPHPELVAVSALAQRIEDRPFVGYLNVFRGIYAAVFSDGSRSTAVLSCSGRPFCIKIGCAVPHTMTDLWGNPLPSHLFDGSVAYLTADVPADVLMKAIKRLEAEE